MYHGMISLPPHIRNYSYFDHKYPSGLTFTSWHEGPCNVIVGLKVKFGKNIVSFSETNWKYILSVITQLCDIDLWVIK